MKFSRLFQIFIVVFLAEDVVFGKILVIGFKLHHGFTHTCLWFQIVSRIASRTVFNAVVHILVIGFKSHHRLIL